MQLHDTLDPKVTGLVQLHDTLDPKVTGPVQLHDTLDPKVTGLVQLPDTLNPKVTGPVQLPDCLPGLHDLGQKEFGNSVKVRLTLVLKGDFFQPFIVKEILLLAFISPFRKL